MLTKSPPLWRTDSGDRPSIWDLTLVSVLQCKTCCLALVRLTTGPQQCSRSCLPRASSQHPGLCCQAEGYVWCVPSNQRTSLGAWHVTLFLSIRASDAASQLCVSVLSVLAVSRGRRGPSQRGVFRRAWCCACAALHCCAQAVRCHSCHFL